MPDLRLDYVATMQGAIRNARTYSLALNGDALYVIDVGPAMGLKPRVRGLVKVLTEMMVKRMKAKMDATVQAGMNRVDARGHAPLANEKGNHAFAPADLESCTMGLNGWGSRTLKLTTSGQSFAFRATPPVSEAELEAFGVAVCAWAGV